MLIFYTASPLRDSNIRARPLPKDFVGVHHIVERGGTKRPQL